MALAGNRFGNSDGHNLLDRQWLMHRLLSRLNTGAGASNGRGGVAGGVPPAYSAPFMGRTVASQPSAAESQVFNERVKNKALYGSYGRGGIERERIYADTLAEAAKRQMTPKDRADIELKKREHDLRKKGKWNWKGDEFGDGGTGTDSTVPAGSGQVLSGEPIGGLPAVAAQAQAPVMGAAPQRTTPVLRDAVPTMAVPPGTVREGLGQAPDTLDMTNMPQGGGMITKQNPDGSTAYYWANDTGQIGRERVPLGGDGQPPVVPGTAQAPDLGNESPHMWDMTPVLRDVVRSIMAEAGQKRAATPKQPVKKEKKVVSVKDAARKRIRQKKDDQPVDLWGSGQPAPSGKNIFEELRDYLGYAKRRAY